MPRTAKLFRNGRSQAVRLPSDFRFEGDEVFIWRTSGGDVVLSSRPESWEDFFELAMGVPKEFMAGRGDAPPQKPAPFR